MKNDLKKLSESNQKNRGQKNNNETGIKIKKVIYEFKRKTIILKGMKKGVSKNHPI